MDQLSAQLGVITQQLAMLNEKQGQYDQLLAQLNQKIETPAFPVEIGPQVSLDLFRIPDPIKSIPSFDGNKKQVASWLKTAEDTLKMFEGIVQPQQYSMYLQAVKNKIEGKTKDILCLAGDPQNFEEVRQVLVDALGDKQELPYYKSQLWGNKQEDGMSVHTFFNKTKEITQNIKTLAKQNPIYNGSWQAICNFIEEDTLAAFISGLRKPYFGYAQAAKPKTIEEAYAFLCKFTSNENIITNSKKTNVSGKSNHYLTNQKPHHLKTNQPNNHNFGPNLQNRNKDFGQSGQRKLHPHDNPIHTPMDVDPSARSRLTFNKNMINNHEVEEDTPKDQENEENFQLDVLSDTED